MRCATGAEQEDRPSTRLEPVCMLNRELIPSDRTNAIDTDQACSTATLAATPGKERACPLVESRSDSDPTRPPPQGDPVQALFGLNDSRMLLDCQSAAALMLGGSVVLADSTLHVATLGYYSCVGYNNYDFDDRGECWRSVYVKVRGRLRWGRVERCSKALDRGESRPCASPLRSRCQLSEIGLGASNSAVHRPHALFRITRAGNRTLRHQFLEVVEVSRR